jgi:mannosyltransferase
MTSTTTATATASEARSTQWRRSARSSQQETVAVFALAALALGLRLTSLSRSLFTDETYSLALAQRSIGRMVALFGYEANGTPYSIILWPLIRLFGTSEALLRSPALLAGTLSVPAMWWAARQLTTRREVPLLAAALLAINPMAVWYSQEARAYAFVVLSACLAFGALARAISQPDGRRAWIGYVAAMTMLAYCDLLAAPIAMPAQVLIARRGGREGMRRWLLSLVALGVCCVPLLVAALISRSRRNALYWLPKPDRGLVELALQEFTGGFSGVSAVRWATLGSGAALVAAAFWRLRRSDPLSERATLAIAACWGIAPGVILLAVSAILPVFWPRYAILALPGLCLLVALAAGRVWEDRRGPALVVGCLAILLIAGTFADVRQRTALQEDWPPIAAWLRAERAYGEPTIVDNALVLPSLGYYDPAFRARNGNLIVQEWHDHPLPAGFVGFKDRTSYGSVPDGPPSATTFARLARGGDGTVWLIVSEVDDSLQEDPRTGPAVAWARQHCRIQVRESTGVWVLRATRCAGPIAGQPRATVG